MQGALSWCCSIGAESEWAIYKTRKGCIGQGLPGGDEGLSVSRKPWNAK